MTGLLPFGQPIRGLMQVAVIVDDIEAAMDHWIKILNVGPFFYFDRFPLANTRYRGRPEPTELSLALAYSGSMCIELIRDYSPGSSVYKDIRDQRGFGFHHWAVSTRDFDAEVERYEAAGHELAFYCEVPAVNGRAAYMDTTAQLGGMVELIELNPEVEGFFADMRRAAENWDGSDPIRRLG